MKSTEKTLNSAQMNQAQSQHQSMMLQAYTNRNLYDTTRLKMKKNKIVLQILRWEGLKCLIKTIKLEGLICLIKKIKVLSQSDNNRSDSVESTNLWEQIKVQQRLGRLDRCQLLSQMLTKAYKVTSPQSTTMTKMTFLKNCQNIQAVKQPRVYSITMSGTI